MLNKPAKTVRRARKLRRTMSLPKVLLWQRLRERPAGFKFRHQHPAGPLVLDFYCAKARLCVEVDGEAHSRGGQPAFDEARNALLSEHGIATLRVTARDVLANMDGVIAYIVDAAETRPPLHPPATPGGPPPRDKLGED